MSSLKARLLVVDDEPLILDLCARILSGAGYEIRCTTSPRKAVELVQKESFSGLITDIKMREFNGFELLRKVRQVCELPTVIMTGYASLDTALESLKLGAQDLLMKPFTPEELLTTVKNALAKGWEKAELQANLRASYAFFENVPGGIAIVNPQGVILEINRAYAEILGINQVEVLGKPVEEVLSFSQLKEILTTGKRSAGRMISLKNKKFFLNEGPIYSSGHLNGGFSQLLFPDDRVTKAMLEKLRALEDEVNYYRAQVLSHYQARYTFASIIGGSPSFKEAVALAQKAAASDAPVLLMGESGTGKELFAQAIHHASPRGRGPFVPVNCATIPDTLLESELFGYEEGAFTGARKGGKPGKIELAAGGTLFLDEIGDLSPILQAKLLRFLEDGQIEKIGGAHYYRVNTRVVAATNKDLQEMVAKKMFREDLYFRLNVLPIQLPPLRARQEDIPLLVGYFFEKLEARYCLRKSLSPDALRLLVDYSWPGNVRELENMVEQLFNRVDGDVIGPEDLPGVIRAGTWLPWRPDSSRTLAQVIEDVEKEMIKHALSTVNGNKVRAARKLGVPRSSFYEKLKRFNLI
ncbi:MAG: sigma 54-interacting transcriptional regulator [Bacillota bacterium]|nr:sigma 54-interacting transcriptional regulator [Bacillota bacterium]